MNRTFSLILTFALSVFSVTAAEAALPLSDDMTPPTLSGSVPVLELYTSQACGACPKANEEFAEFAATHNVIALTFPVDYWDYLGWEDTFAQPAFTERQKAYNNTLGRRGPYTPQVIFNGAEHCAASREKTMKSTLEVMQNKAPRAMNIAYDGKTATITGGNGEPADIWLIEYVPGDTFETPLSGVNTNTPMRYHNRVTGLTFVSRMTDKAASVAAHCVRACTLIVQGADLGPVIAAVDYQAP